MPSDNLEARIRRIEQELGIDEERHRAKAKKIAHENNWDLLEVNDPSGPVAYAVFSFRMLNTTDTKALQEYPSHRVYNREEAKNYDHAVIEIEIRE